MVSQKNEVSIPTGARIVVRVSEGVDPDDGRMKFRDYLGHVVFWDGQALRLIRDASANGSRPVQEVTISRKDIVSLRPVPERKTGR